MLQVCGKFAASLPQTFHFGKGSSSNLDFIVPRVKTCESGSFFYHGIKNWNELPRHVKECKGKESFKENVKKHLMEKGLKKHNCEFHFY